MAMEDYKRKSAARHRIGGPSDFPKGPHLAIIDFGTCYHEGDERSRTNPGHGYPAYTETTINYSWWNMSDRDCWIEEIGERMGVGTYSSKKDFIALENGIRVEPRMSVSVEV